MSQPLLVLASGSPRRRELLEAAGYRPTVMPARDGVEEAGFGKTEVPAELVVDLAVRKRDDVAGRLAANADRGATLVLAADTVAECGGAILGKPRDADHAREMMRRLSGREHRVYTGVALSRIEAGAVEALGGRVEATTLRMDDLSDAWIEDYAQSGAWRGKAGGFGYQDGLGFVHIVEGSESNVVGLPMELTDAWLASVGCFPGGQGEA